MKSTMMSAKSRFIKGILLSVLGLSILCTSNAAQAASPRKLASTPANKFAEAVATSSERDMGMLWKMRSYRSDITKACKAENVKAIAEYIKTAASDSKFNAGKLKNVIYFIQIAYYHEYGVRAISYGADVRDPVNEAMAAIAKHKKFLASDTTTQKLRTQWSVSIDSTGGLCYATEGMSAIFERFAKDSKLSRVREECTTIEKLLYSIDRQAGIHVRKGSSSPWFKAFEGKPVQSIAKLALKKGYTSSNEYLINKALWALGAHLSKYSPETYKQCHTIVSQAYSAHKKNSGPWFWSAKCIAEHFRGKTSDGKSVNSGDLKKGLKKTLFPNTFKYPDQNITFKTSLPKERIDKLAKALKLVREEFFKHCPHEKPVKGDRNKHLTLVIYANNKLYREHQYSLFNVSSVNNGGIYIESQGALYTYDRQCPRESYLTLEDLIRHEYVHYLDGRYNVWGGYEGRGTVFKKAPVAWYLEGLAESLTGTVEGKGVFPRRKLVRRMRRLMPLSKLVTCTYQRDGFSFYSDGSIFFCFMMNRKPELLQELFKAIRGNNKQTLTKLFRRIGSDKDLQKQYTNYFNEIKRELRKRKGNFYEDLTGQKAY